jgi:type I restriction enzyme S subunit
MLFLELFINSISLEPYVTATAQPKMNQAKLNSIVVPLPPLAEQARIVARVDELMRLCDALEEKGRLEAEQHARLLSTLLGTLTDSATPEELAANWQRVAEHLDLLLDRPKAVDELESVVLRAAVRGLLSPRGDGSAARDDSGPGSCSWVRVQLGSVVDLLNGYAFKSDWFQPSGVRLLRNINVAHGSLDWASKVCVSPELAAEYRRFELAESDLVLTLDRPIISTGLKLATVRKADLPCLLLQRVARLTPDPTRLSRDFLALWMQSDRFMDAIDPGRSNGVPHISTKQVGELPIDLPPLAEQARIVARVTELRRLCATLRERLQAQQATLGQR